VLFETEAEPKLRDVTLSRRVESMPSLPIEPDGPLGDAFLARGCINFHDAVRLVRDMPWGRPSRPDAVTIITESVGTATDKHFLLASLARELGNTELQIVLGIHRMSAETHPAAAVVLAKAGLQSLPEAMVWLRWYGGDYDFSSMRAGARAVVVLQEELITLDKMPEYLEQRHKEVLVRFLNSSRRDDLPDLKALWALREEALDSVIAEQEAHRQAELQRALDIATAQEQARDRALTDAERSAEEAQRDIRERAAAEAERREQYEAAAAEREAAAAEREKQRAARGDGEATGRRTTRRAPGQRGAPEPEPEEIEEEETSVRRTTRKAPTSKLADEAAPSGGSSRKRTRRAPGQPAAEPQEGEPQAEVAEPPSSGPTPKRKSTRRPPTVSGGEVQAPRPAHPDEPAAPSEAVAEAGMDSMKAASTAVSEPETAPRRKATRKPPTARKMAPSNDEPAAEPEADTPAAPAAAAPAPKAAPKRKRTRKAPGRKK